MSDVVYQPDRVLDIAMEIGVNLLKCGAEISRVENTISYICKAYGATDIDVFAIPTLIVATIVINGNAYTSKVKRNYTVSTDLYRLEKFNKLSRFICKEKPSLESVKAKAKEIQDMKDYNLALIYLGSFLTSFGFAIIFGGTIRDGLAAGIVALIMTFFLRVQKKTFNQMIHTLLCSLIGGFFSVVMCWIGIGENIAYVMIGAIMIVIPGLMVATSIKDIMCDDILSGTLRLFQALVSTAAIVAGFSVWTMIYGGNVSIGEQSEWWMLLISTILGTVGYSIVFNIKYKFLIVGTLGGVISYFTYYFVDIISNNNVFLAMLAGTLIAGIYSEILARVLKAPNTVFLLPAIITLIPGALFYYTMYYLINWNEALFNANSINMVLANLAMAVGIIIVSVGVQVISKFYRRLKNRSIL